MKHDERVVEAVARALCVAANIDPNSIPVGTRLAWVTLVPEARATLDAINASGIAWVAPWEAPVKGGEWESISDGDQYSSDELWDEWRNTYLAEQGEQE